MILVFRADDFQVGNKVADKVIKIMGPRQYVSYSPITNSPSTQGTDFHKHKGKEKYQLAVQKCGGSKNKNRSYAVTFQKKLYVLITEDQMHRILLHGQIKTSLQGDCCHKYQFQLLKKYEVKYLK